MIIYLFDHDWNSKDGSVWFTALDVAFGEMLSRDVEQLQEPGRTTHQGYTDPNAVIFVHSNMEPSWIVKSRESNVVCNFVLVRTGGDQPIPVHCPTNVHACSWKPDDFGNGNPPLRLARLIEQLKGAEINDFGWSLLQPDPVEIIFAAKLIDEAKRHEGTNLHGIDIGVIPDDLAVIAAALLEADSTNTSIFQSRIEEFEAALNKQT